MKLFVVVLGCLLMVAFLTWMTLSLQQIEVHREGAKHAQELAQQQQHAQPAPPQTNAPATP